MVNFVVSPTLLEFPPLLEESTLCQLALDEVL